MRLHRWDPKSAPAQSPVGMRCFACGKRQFEAASSCPGREAAIQLVLAYHEAMALKDSITHYIEAKHTTPACLTAAFPNAKRKLIAELGQHFPTNLDGLPPVTISAKEWAVLTGKAAWADHLDRNGLSEWDRFNEVTAKFRAGE